MYTSLSIRLEYYKGYGKVGYKIKKYRKGQEGCYGPKVDGFKPSRGELKVNVTNTLTKISRSCPCTSIVFSVFFPYPYRV